MENQGAGPHVLSVMQPMRSMKTGPSRIIPFLGVILACTALIPIGAERHWNHSVSAREEHSLSGPITSSTAPNEDPPAKPTPQAFPAKVIVETIRTHSVHRGQVDWAKAEPEFLERIAKSQTDQEKGAAVTQLFASMNDVHSNLQFGGRSYGHYEGVDEETGRRLMPLLKREQGQSGRVTSKMLDGGVGYLLVPTMAVYTAEQVAAKARELREALSKTAAENPRGWIVDLRLNGGGNLYPMLVGLTPLLGEGVVGGTIDADGRKVHDWVLKPDGLYWRDPSGDRRFAALDLRVKLPEPNPPVVVLIGPITRSSGQATALAFKGRDRCLLLGEPTAKGYTTTTHPFAISPTITLSLAVGYMADRKGNACKLQVLPEETVQGGDDFDHLQNDKKIQAAKVWLKKK